MSIDTYKDRKRGLGKGLESLFSENPISPQQTHSSSKENEVYKELSLTKIKPDPKQPRKYFSEKELEQLTHSISEKGILQPLVVTPDQDHEGNYTIIAGERRFRAAFKAGLHRVPVVIRKVKNSKEALEWALIENIQREDLNILEEAEAYETLMKSHKLTQQDISEVVSKDRSSIANTLRLLTLPPMVKTFLREGKLSFGQAKVLLSCPSKNLQTSLARKAIKQGLSIKKLQKLIDSYGDKKEIEIKKETNIPFLKPIIKELERKFHTTVKIDYKKGKGKVELEFYSNEQFTEMIESLRQ